jgi:hypothetical protein
MYAKARSLRHTPIEQIWLEEIRHAGKPLTARAHRVPLQPATPAPSSRATRRETWNCRPFARLAVVPGPFIGWLPWGLGPAWKAFSCLCSFFIRGAVRGCAVAGALEHCLSRVDAIGDLGVHSCPAGGPSRTLVNLPMAMLLLADLPAPVPPTGDDPNHCHKQRNKGYGCYVGAKCHPHFPQYTGKP